MRNLVRYAGLVHARPPNLRLLQSKSRPTASPQRPLWRFPACPSRTPASRTRPSARSTQSSWLCDFRRIRCNGLRTNIQPHLIRRSCRHVARRRRRVGLEFRCSHMVASAIRNLKLRAFASARIFFAKLDLVVLDQGLADRHSLRFQERVRHSAADQHRIGNLHQIFNHFDLVADFCSARESPRTAAQDYSQPCLNTPTLFPSAIQPRIAAQTW